MEVYWKHKELFVGLVIMMGGIKNARLHKCLYQALIRLLLKEFESKFEAVPAFNLEELSLGLSQEEFE